MTFQITKSVLDGLPYDYAGEVEKFRQARLAHRFTGDVAPTAPALIERAIRRVQTEGKADDFVADYIIIDDIPVPTLAERKAVLSGAIRSAEAAALTRLISPARERLLTLDLTAVQAKPEALRSDADRALLAKAAVIAARREIIHRHAATQEIAVEELTDATIDGWTPAAFPS
jgi:hypothetical protein